METGAYEFGPYRQDASSRILTRHGSPVAIAPKTFDTLLYLVVNAGRTVSREELIRAVWPDTFVEEGNLNYNISQIRKILGESAPGVHYIQTLPKRGYRFVAPVTSGRDSLPQVHPISTPSAPAARPWFHRIRPALVFIPAATATLMAWFVLKHDDTGRTAMRAPARLTSDSGLTMTPAISSDGKLVAYASDRSGEGNLDIWVQQADRGEPVRLTHHLADDYDPSFSPDGLTIAFRSERDGGGVYAISTLGGEERKVVSGGRRPKISPDGKWIAYWVGSAAGDAMSSFLNPGSARIYVAPLTGGAAHQLRSDFAAAAFPIWAPDSRHILFLGNRDRNESRETTTDWWVTSIQDGEVVETGLRNELHKLGFVSASQAPEAWVPGKGALMSATLDDTRNLWEVPLSERSWKASGIPRRITWGTLMDVQPAVAGDRAVFASLNENLDIWSLPIRPDRAEVTGDPQKLTQDSFAHGYPAVSPDGRMLAFSSRRSGNRDIWVKDLRTGKEHIVSAPPGPSWNPNFSPDGGSLIYRSAHNGVLTAFTVSAAGGSVQKVCEYCRDYGWSGDGARLAVIGKTPARVFVLDRGSGKRLALLDHPQRVLWNARFSPGDRWVLFNATWSNRSQIFVAAMREDGPIPESEWIPIANNGWDDKPRWSPDGNVVYFVSDRDLFRCIWAQRLDAAKHPVGPPIPIFHAHAARRSMGSVGMGDLGISVACDKIVFNMSERTGNLWMTRLD